MRTIDRAKVRIPSTHTAFCGKYAMHTGIRAADHACVGHVLPGARPLVITRARSAEEHPAIPIAVAGAWAVGFAQIARIVVTGGAGLNIPELGGIGHVTGHGEILPAECIDAGTDGGNFTADAANLRCADHGLPGQNTAHQQPENDQDDGKLNQRKTMFHRSSIQHWRIKSKNNHAAVLLAVLPSQR